MVEHDEEAIREADYVFDIGPGAGVHGGQVSQPRHARSGRCDDGKLITGQYLTGKRERSRYPPPGARARRRKLKVVKATGNNLQECHGRFPAGQIRLRDRRVGRRKIHADHRDAVQDGVDEPERCAADAGPAKPSRGWSISTR